MTGVDGHVRILLQLLRRLASEEPVPSVDLEAELDISSRTLRRYIKALKDNGLTGIQTVRGKGYQLAFHLGDWEQLLPRTLVADLAELRILEHLHPLPVTITKRAQIQMLNSLLKQASGDIRKVEDRLSRSLLVREEIPRGTEPLKGRSSDPESLGAKLRKCLEAIVLLHPLQFDYTDSKSALSHRVVEPLGCLYTSGTWYCVAHDTAPGKGRRNFALTRMRNLSIQTSASYIHPEKFSMERAFTGAWGIWRQPQDQIEPLEFLVDSPLLQFFRECQFPEPNRKVQQRDGRLRVRTSFANLQETARWLMPYAEYLEIVRPDALRLELRRMAEATLQRVAR